MTKYVWNPFTSNLDAQLTPFIEDFQEIAADQYVPYAELVSSSFSGVKGQWSYNNDKYYKCIATDTWHISPNEEFIDEKIRDLLKEFVNQYVPSSLVPNNSATGIKGQWSFQVGHSSHKGYLKICIATNTWVRFEVDTLF